VRASKVRTNPKETLIDEVVEYINGSQLRAVRARFYVEVVKLLKVRLRVIG
jgi:hypothetical protein